MSWHKPFHEKSFYQYSVDLDLDEINIKPSSDFQSTVRKNYFQDSSPNNSIAILVFRKDKVGTNNLDYLLISSYYVDDSYKNTTGNAYKNT